MNRLDFLQNQISGKNFVYSVPVGSQKKGQTKIHRHPKSVDGLLEVPPHIHSLADFWDEILAKFSNNLALEQISYKDLNNLAMSLGSWLYENKHQKIYLYAKNSPQWTITDIASWNYGRINIPLYDTLGEQAFFHILKLTQGTAIFITDSMSESLVKNLSIKKQKISTVVYFDKPSEANALKLKNLGLKIQIFSDLVKKKIINRPKLNLNQHLTYSFTSGTTGLPKGVIATHKIAISQVLAMKGHYQMNETDVHLSFLPIAHTFQRFISWHMLSNGGNIKYSQFPITQITKDFARAKPTTLPMVPRLLNKFYPICKGLYEKDGNGSKIKGMFGGKLRLMVTGSAPISPQILTFFKKALQCDVREGYGQTETTAASFVTYQGDINYGHVGGPNRTTQFKLVDVPQMNYLTSDKPPKGQICTRGNSVFSQYYLDPQNTKETVDEEGWNHSGDIGVILPNGALKIIDRKKNIYKLSQGEYIAPEKVCPYVAQCFLYGDSMQYFNVAVIHPNFDMLIAAAKKMGINETDPKKLASNKQLEAFVLKQMTDHGKKEGLFGFELAKKLRIWPVSFGTLGIFTSTMKLQRHIAKKAFLSQIEQMYKEQ